MFSVDTLTSCCNWVPSGKLGGATPFIAAMALNTFVGQSNVDDLPTGEKMSSLRAWSVMAFMSSAKV